MSISVRTAQVELARLGYYKGKIDGLHGPLTAGAQEAALGELVPRVGWRDWSTRRKRVAAVQAILRHEDIETGVVDGYYGPQTEYALEVWEHRSRTGKDPEPWRDNIEATPDEVESARHTVWPRQSSLFSYYGSVGKNQAMLQLPFPMKIAWNLSQSVTRFSIHEKVHDSALRVFKRIESHYSPEDISKHGFDLFGGCLNVRKMRGGSSWSTHSWGIAIDFDPARNRFKWGRDRAYLDHPDCEQFWRFWEEEGWLSLGRARNFDFMHVQAAGL